MRAKLKSWGKALCKRKRKRAIELQMDRADQLLTAPEIRRIEESDVCSGACLHLRALLKGEVVPFPPSIYRNVLAYLWSQILLDNGQRA